MGCPRRWTVTGNLAGDITLTRVGQITTLEDGTTLSYDQTDVASTNLTDRMTTHAHDGRGNRTTRG